MTAQKHVREAIDCAQSIIRSRSKRGESVDIESVARFMGVTEISPSNMTADGYLGRRADGTLVIRHRTGVNRARTRFTIAHEIAHIILSNVEGRPIAVSGTYRRDIGEEKAVNRIAAELLMPASHLVEELREQPAASWRTIYRLSHQYRVSGSAMAFRLLELEALHAVSLRINIDGMGPHSPYSCSERHAIKLCNGVDFELDRIWRESKYNSNHSVLVVVDGTPYEIGCEGDVRSFSTRLGDVQTYWVLGWRAAET